MFGAFLGSILVVFGQGGYLLEIQQITQGVSRFLGVFLYVFGFILITHAFFELPSLEEFEQQKKIVKLFVISESGISLYTKDFLKNNVGKPVQVNSKDIDDLSI